jgi:hypothetical protein
VEQQINKAIRTKGFRKFERYLAANTGKTLVQMAKDLGVNEQRFIVYHSKWLDEQAKALKVAPLRLSDDEE